MMSRALRDITLLVATALCYNIFNDIRNNINHILTQVLKICDVVPCMLIANNEAATDQRTL